MPRLPRFPPTSPFAPRRSPIGARRRESPQKLKKEAGASEASLKLAPNPDILATIAKPGPKRPRLVIGFAAETENVIANAHGEAPRQGRRLDRRQ